MPSSEFLSIQREIKKKQNNVFIHIGRFSPQKNQKLLIKAFNQLDQRGYKTNLYIIGPGYDSEDGKKLKKLAKKHIKFIGEKHNVIDYLKAADGFCLTSIHEGMPITLIEALACGCIPICTPAGGIKNMIEDGITGFLSKTFDEKDYYNTVLRFLKEKNKIDRKKLIDTFNSLYHIEVCAKNYLEAFQN